MFHGLSSGKSAAIACVPTVNNKYLYIFTFLTCFSWGRDEKLFQLTIILDRLL